MNAHVQAQPPRRERNAAAVPLAPRAPLALRRSHCLLTRLHASGCRACEQACPTRALRIGAAGVALYGACTGCGRCQAACPVGALAAEGFDGALEPVRCGDGGDVSIECVRSPQRGDAQVPCLGGIAPSALLSLCAATPGRGVVLVDRGACAGCDSGGGRQHPSCGTVDQVRAWMRIAGVPEARLPRIAPAAHDAAAAGRVMAGGQDPLQSHGRARRSFLGALAQPGASRVAVAPAQAQAPRQAILAALSTLAALHGGRVAADLFHHVEVGAACRGLRVCAMACPTGALVRYRNDEAGVNGVAFDSRDCIGCQHCAAICPQQALRVLPGPGAGLGRRPLTRFVQRECVDCGARFAAVENQADAARCERCGKSAQLARSAFATLFSRKNPTPGDGVTGREETR